jgi:hypothetical protein
MMWAAYQDSVTDEWSIVEYRGRFSRECAWTSMCEMMKPMTEWDEPLAKKVIAPIEARDEFEARNILTNALARQLRFDDGRSQRKFFSTPVPSDVII